MNISDKIKENKVVVLGSGALVLAGAAYVATGSNEEVNTLDFSKGKVATTDNKAKPPVRKTIRVPDPSYKEAPDFEDFQAIAKMRVHAMAPFKKDTDAWAKDLLSLRMQREKLKLYKDGSEVAKAEAEIAEHKAKAAQFNSNNVSFEESDEFDDSGVVAVFDENSKANAQHVYNIRSLRMELFSVGNKYAKTSATFSIGSEKFLNVKANQVIASQFLINELDQSNYCAKVTDFASSNAKSVTISRS